MNTVFIGDNKLRLQAYCRWPFTFDCSFVPQRFTSVPNTQVTLVKLLKLHPPETISDSKQFAAQFTAHV